MAEILERTLNTRVAPGRILRCHANYQAPNLRQDTGPPRSASGVRPLARHQLAMPSEYGVRRDDRGHPRERATPEALADHGETPAFIIAQPQPSTVQLRPEHAIFFAEELNDVELLSIKPPEQRRKEQVERNHARSLRQRRWTQFSDTTGIVQRARRALKYRRVTPHRRRAAPNRAHA